MGYKLAGSDPLGDVISWNLKRRHLSSSQKAAIAVDSLPLFEAEAKRRQGERNDLKKDGNFPQKIGESESGKKHDTEAASKAAESFGTNRQYVSDANAFAKQWTPSEKVAIARALEDELKAQAKERQGTRTDLNIQENFPESENKQSRDLAAEKAGFGNGKTYQQAINRQ